MKKLLTIFFFYNSFLDILNVLKAIVKMEQELLNGKMEMFIKENGKMGISMVKGKSIQMEIFMKENLKTES